MSNEIKFLTYVLGQIPVHARFTNNGYGGIVIATTGPGGAAGIAPEQIPALKQWLEEQFPDA